MTQEFRSKMVLRPNEYSTLDLIEEYVRRHSLQKPWEEVLDRSEFEALFNPENETITFRLKDRQGAQHAGVAVAIDTDDLIVMPEHHILNLIGKVFLTHLEQGLPLRAKGSVYHTEVVTN